MAEEEQETVYVVAPGVVIYTDSGDVFFAGGVITPENVGSLSSFRALVVAGKIVASDGGNEPPPDDGGKWNYTDIDDALSDTSHNPVENRIVTAAIIVLQKADNSVRARLDALEEAQAEPIPQEEIRAMWEVAEADKEAENGEKIS